MYRLRFYSVADYIIDIYQRPVMKNLPAGAVSRIIEYHFEKKKKKKKIMLLFPWASSDVLATDL